MEAVIKASSSGPTSTQPSPSATGSAPGITREQGGQAIDPAAQSSLAVRVRPTPRDATSSGTVSEPVAHARGDSGRSAAAESASASVEHRLSLLPDYAKETHVGRYLSGTHITRFGERKLRDCECTIVDGKFVDRTGQRFGSKLTRGAEDKEGFCYAFDRRDGKPLLYIYGKSRNPFKNVAHSSVIGKPKAGEEEPKWLATGTQRFKEDGMTLDRVDMFSGHYWPATAHFKQYLDFLESQGVRNFQIDTLQVVAGELTPENAVFRHMSDSQWMDAKGRYGALSAGARHVLRMAHVHLEAVTLERARTLAAGSETAARIALPVLQTYKRHLASPLPAASLRATWDADEAAFHAALQELQDSHFIEDGKLVDQCAELFVVDFAPGELSELAARGMPMAQSTPQASASSN